MKQLRIDISARLATLKTGTPQIKYINTWNGQAEKLKSQDKNESVAFQCPALFVEIITNDIKTLGNGNQMYDPFDVKIHILHREDKSTNMDENLLVEDVAQRVYACMHKWSANGTSGFFRIDEERDYEHTNIYHLIQTYRTCYVDSTLNEPRNPVIVTPDIVVDAEIVETEADLEG